MYSRFDLAKHLVDRHQTLLLETCQSLEIALNLVSDHFCVANLEIQVDLLWLDGPIAICAAELLVLWSRVLQVELSLLAEGSLQLFEGQVVGQLWV